MFLPAEIPHLRAEVAQRQALRTLVTQLAQQGDPVSAQILENHLNSCVITAIKGNNPKEREKVLKEITEVFEMSTKV